MTLSSAMEKHPASPIDPLSRFIGRLYRNEPRLTATGMLLLLAMVPTLAAMLIDPRTVNGVGVWVKPFKFQLSIIVHFWTVALFLDLLPDRVRARALVRSLVTAMVIAAIFEIAYIMLQAAKGEASHFNETTLFAMAMYNLMGLGALTLVVATAIFGAMVLRHRPADDVRSLAAGLGLVLGGVLGGLSGLYMSVQSGHWVGTPGGDAAVIPLFGWSLAVGDLRVAHFLGLHAMQALPVVALLAGRVVPADGRKAVILLAAVAWTALTVATFLQAVLGMPLLPR